MTNFEPALRARERFRDYCGEREWRTTDFAAASGIGAATVYRILSGKSVPNAQFIAACAVLFGDAALFDLFEFGPVRPDRKASTTRS